MFLAFNTFRGVLNMKKIRSYVSLLIILILMLSLSACGGGNEKYNVVKKLEDQQFCVAFRDGDTSGDAVIAALAVLQNNGTVSSLAAKWFGSDISLLKGDPKAIETLETELGGKVEKRSYIVGYDSGRLPISGDDSNGKASGFDVELAKAFCELLGWRVKFVAIDPADAVVELDSGNVDCVMGGYVYNSEEKEITQSPVYMDNTVVVATLKNSGVHSLRGLSGKTLTIGNTGYYSSIMEKYPALSEKPKYVVTISGDMNECFDALENGKADAIIADLVSLDYYR